jgi:hypothetical protein
MVYTSALFSITVGCVSARLPWEDRKRLLGNPPVVVPNALDSKLY